MVKNVTGYDLWKLFAGGFGTLCAMTEVTFKVLPADETETTLCCGLGRERRVSRRCARRMSSAGDDGSAAFLPTAGASRSGDHRSGGGRSRSRCAALEGPAPSVPSAPAGRRHMRAGDRELEGLAPALSVMLWREIRDVALLPPAPPLWRISVAPTAVAPLGEGSSAGSKWRGSRTGQHGLLWLAVEDATEARAGADPRGAATPGATRRSVAAAPSCSARCRSSSRRSQRSPA